MLWSLIRILFFVALVAALSLVAGALLEVDGRIRVAVGAMEFTFGPLQGIVLVLLGLIALWLLLRIVGFLVALLRFVTGDETALSRFFDRSRERRGFRALADGMLALAAGESRRAMSKAGKAERLLRRPELTDLLLADAAEAAGDRTRARAVYKRMVTHDATRFAGVRGLMRQKLAEGDTDTAMKLAEKGFALKPGHGETQDTLLRLQAEHEDWAGARRTLNAKLRHGTLPRDVHKRRDAVLALAEARERIAGGEEARGREAAIEANRLSPDLVPAAVAAARAHVAQGKPRAAEKVLSQAWKTQPHPDLAAAFAGVAPEETPEARLKRFRTLTRQAPESAETRMLRAELLIAAEDFPAARKALGDLAERDPTSRSLAIMAAIERGQGEDDAVVRGWLTRALSAPRGPQWTCGNCGTIWGEWRPVCATCHGFDTLAWKSPPAGEAASPHSSEMLPVLVDGGQTTTGETGPETPPREEPEPGR